ncbi:GroES (chaperonin 10)-like protein [Rhypophila sp. PSN 637]
MATQTGITIAGPNEPYTIVDNIPQPAPGPGEALVKTLYVGLNPVDPLMQHTGLLIESFPAVAGSDFVGIVLTTGPNTSKLPPGSIVFGCAPIGLNRFSPFQETFLVLEYTDALKDNGAKVEQGATVGAGVLTAALGLVEGQKIELEASSEEKDEWVVVMGGIGTVGQYAVQIARLVGYKVLASCSPSKAEIPLSAGAHATFDSRAPIDEQLSEIERLTDGGHFIGVFDASAQASEISLAALRGISKEEKYFSHICCPNLALSDFQTREWAGAAAALACTEVCGGYAVGV